MVVGNKIGEYQDIFWLYCMKNQTYITLTPTHIHKHHETKIQYEILSLKHIPTIYSLHILMRDLKSLVY